MSLFRLSPPRPSPLQLPEPFLSLSNDPNEVASSLWLSPVEALEMARQRQIVLPPPTTYILRELQLVRTIDDVFAQSVSALTHAQVAGSGGARHLSAVW